MALTDEELRSTLLDLASQWRLQAENLVSAGWDETYSSFPVLRQYQIGMAGSLSCGADEIVSILGIDPRSLWPDQVRLPPLPEAERSRLTWSDGAKP